MPFDGHNQIVRKQGKKTTALMLTSKRIRKDIVYKSKCQLPMSMGSTRTVTKLSVWSGCRHMGKFVVLHGGAGGY